MPPPVFIPLRQHSEYSIIDGIVRIHDVVRRAAEDNMPALALTDLNNLFGMVKFYQAARTKGIKPIIGCDLWLTNDVNRDQPFRVLLLCQSQAGYLRLCELLSRAYRDNSYRGRAEVRKEWFDELGTEGLIALSGAAGGEIGQALLAGHYDRAGVFAQEWAARFQHRFYLEVQRAGFPRGEVLVRTTVELAAQQSLPLVATHPIQYLRPDDFKAHEARVCIAEGYILSDQRRPRRFTEQQYFKTQAEMAKLFNDLPEALANSVEIAKRCNLVLQLGKNYLPQFPTPDGISLDDYLCRRAEVGLREQLVLRYPVDEIRIAHEPKYHRRLEFEMGTITQMGFSGYFLIVADFINWAKKNGVPVGPGRGSGAGSLVAYSLGITDLDPLRYDLLFERFLNPERVSMPDFDVDFCQDGRERVIDYVKHTYGADSVSQIVTFGTMAAKAVVRDVGRVLDLPYLFVDQLAKLIPNELGISLAKARQQEPQINARAAAEEEVAELLELAERLEGLTRNVGMHAGGVLIAPGKLTDFCPLYVAAGSESVVSQFDKDDVEKIGLVKFDFLGLRTLTIIDWAVRFIHRLEGARSDGGTSSFSVNLLPLDDSKTYDLLKACNTTAVFQLESRGMKDLIRRLQPDNFEDIVALVALFRPGPLGSGMVDDFINRKHGKAEVDYFHPKLVGVLQPTYGVIVYQEQVMQIAQILSGYTLGAADMLRRAMGKKNAEEMAKHRSIFVDGAVERGVDKRQAEYLFDLMEKFAEYGFNKSHSAAYALIAYQTAYLKAHYPAAFMAATLSADMDDTDKVRTFYEDSLINGLEILPPDINQGDYRFVPVDNHRISYGLGAVKGTGEAAIDAILQVREADGPFHDLFDFCTRIDKRIVNRRVIESLIRAGAFDSFPGNRANLLASVGVALGAAEQRNQSVNQISLFDMRESMAERVSLIVAPSWDEREKLLNEKASLGFYFSGHPFTAYRKEVAAFIKTSLDDLTPQSQPTLLAGIVHAVRTQITRRGKMAFVTLDDGKANVEIAVYNEMYLAHRQLLSEDQLLIVEGKISHNDYSGGLRVVADVLYDLAAARTRFAKAVHLRFNGEADSTKLRNILSPYRQRGCPVHIQYRNGQATCELVLGSDWQVALHDTLLQSLRDWVNADNVSVYYQ